MKKRIWISLLVLIFIVFGLLFNYAYNSKEAPVEPTTPIEDMKPTTKPSGEVPKDENFVSDVLSPFITNNNYGELFDSYALTKTDYLVETQFGGGFYDDEFSSNIIMMTHTKDGKTTTEQLTSGNYLVHLFKENANPFLMVSKKDDTKLVIFYEVSNLNRYPQSGHVYKVEKNGTLSLIYETKGAFELLTRSTAGDLVLTEKIYDDNKNKYPTAFKPYYLHKLTYQDGTFKEISKEYVDPNVKSEKK